MSAEKQTVLERLYRLAPRGALLGLERVRVACARFDHPERRFESVHVAGTNGKGSVSAMLAAMARAGGKRTGLYTSPHLCRFAERIQIDGAPHDEAGLLAVLEDVMDRCPDLTFFETATVAAFVAFARAGVELAVVEVGLGGRLDATNVLEAPLATAIVSIGLDHIDRLGRDLASIAREKAGIIKRGVPVVLGPLPDEADRAVRERADSMGAEVVVATEDASVQSFVASHPPALEGAHQRANACVAVELGRRVRLSSEHMTRGLAAPRWPGRLETIGTPKGDVVLDAAHNLDGARALARWLAGRAPPPSLSALVFGAMADKDYENMLRCLAPFFEHRVYVAPEGRRAADLATLARIAPGQVVRNIPEALTFGRGPVGRDGLVVVTGSIFLVGAARAYLLGLPTDPAVAL